MERQAQNAEETNINYGEIYEDIEKSQLLNKNLRVRPISGFTHGDETRDGR